jgi:ATP-binding cassette subfamily B multidrug efflux pump
VLFHFISMFRWVLIALALVSMTTEAINLAIIWGLSVIVDGVTAQGAPAFLHGEWPLLAFLGLLIFPIYPVASFLLNTLQSHTLSVGMPTAIQWQGHKAVERQDFAFFHDLFAGQVSSRLSQVASAVQQQIIAAFQTIPRFTLQMVGSVVLLSALSWQLAFPVVIWIVLNVLLAFRMAPIFAERSRRTAKQRSLVSGAINDLYGNMQMIKQFAAEDSEAGAIRRILQKSVKVQHSEQRIYRTAEVGVVTLNMLLWLIILSIGFSGLLKGFLTVGEFVAAVYILQRLSGNTFTFLQMGQQIFQAIGTIKDAMPVMTTPPTIVDGPDAAELAVNAGEIRFEHVDFAYKSGKSVIDDLSLTIRPGEKVGLVGLSGAGKTTLVSLLLRFYDVRTARSSSTGRTSEQSRRRACDAISALSPRMSRCCIAQSATISAMADRRRRRTRLPVRRAQQEPTRLSPILPTARAVQVTTLSSATVASSSPGAAPARCHRARSAKGRSNPSAR